MNCKQQIRKIHLFLSKDLADSLQLPPIDSVSTLQDDAYVKILFCIQTACIASLFLTDGPIGHIILTYALLPFVFFPARFSWVKLGYVNLPLPIKFSFYNIFRNFILCRTPLFLSLFIYGADKAFLSYLHPEPVLGYLHIFFYYLLAPIISFTMSQIRLAVDYPHFYSSFFRVTGPFAAINASINLYNFLKNTPDLLSLGSHRLHSNFGAAMGYNPNLDALIYSVFFTGLLVTAINNPIKCDYLLSIPVVLILYCTVILEQNRSCLLAMTLTFGWLFTWNRVRFAMSSLYITAILFSLLALITIFLLPSSPNSYLSRPDYLRPELWLKFYNISFYNKFLGLGDRYIFIVPLSNGEIAPHPHSVLLSSLVRGGLIGFLSMLFIIIFGCLRAYQYAKITKNSIPICVFVTVMIAGLFDFEIKVWQAGWYLAGYWLSIGLALGADSALRTETQKII